MRALRHRQERKATGLFLAEGVKVVSELIASPQAVEAVFSTDMAFLAQMEGGFRKETVSAKELERMSALTTPNVTLAIARMPSVRPVNWDGGLILALDGISIPGNMGTIIRTARWFGVDRILCSENCTDPYGPKVVQGAMGALFHSHIVMCDLVSELSRARSEGFRVMCATLEGTPVHDADCPGRSVLVIGSESHGVSDAVREVCDMEVTVPSHGEGRAVESLNAAVAAGILISHIRNTGARGGK